MNSLRSLCERVTPVAPETTVETACARFDANPSLRLLPVLSNGTVAGLVTRQQAMTARGIVARVAGLIGGRPRVHDAGEDALSISRRIAGPAGAGGLDGFVVTDDGEYLGVGDGLTLLAATVEAADASRRLLAAAQREVGIPLGGLLAVAGLMQRQPLPLDAAAQLRAMISAAESALTFVGDLSGYVGATGAPELSLETVSPRELIDEVDALWQVQAGRRGMRLITSCRADPELLLSLDAGQFKQVLNALVGEAFDAGSGGVVEIRLNARRENGAGWIETEVRDTRPPEAPAAASGPGEPPSFAETRRSAIVEAMGGRIRRARNTGAGTTVSFDVRAPLARSADEIAQAEAAAARRALGHILVVDDNATNRLVAEALCQGFGFTSEAVENGLEAVEAAGLRAYDLVLMDIKMPGMDGVEATRAIRALPGRAATTPIVALTANADPKAVETYRAASMCGVVEKPIKPEALFAAISAALQDEPTETGERRSAA